jgi:hypothetical protein
MSDIDANRREHGDINLRSGQNLLPHPDICVDRYCNTDRHNDRHNDYDGYGHCH